MRYSEYFLPTLKEDPSDAEIASHKLMVRAGMIRKLASGIYNTLPLGLRSIRKVETIVREEMNRAGALELLMPAVLPAELWRESGRWDVYGKELLRFQDRAERDFCIGPTHEEIITDIVRRDIRSYKQLPVNLYQIQPKFRDEVRPRFGVMRAREFLMKDAYSFDADEDSAEESYWNMHEAYTRIFERCGLEFRAVLADTGNIGGSFSHEFMVLAQTGEDVIMTCDDCDYGANLELAETGERGDFEGNSEEERRVEEVHTPDLKTVEDVADFLKVKPRKLIKTMIVVADGEPVIALVRGDQELSKTKLKKVIDAESVEFAGSEMIEEVTGGPLGFSGPVGLKVRTVADRSVKYIKNGVTGANKLDYHLINVNIGRDFKVSEFGDIRVAEEGDPCPRCKEGKLSSSRGIEVGHVFMLGTKYSEAMDATFVDADGNDKPFIMGCYGIGIGRTVAAAIEQNFDEDGIVLPLSIAPFQVTVLPLNLSNEEVVSVSETIYENLSERGVEVLIDDREETAGVKFNDADLIGVPLRVNVGPRGLEEGIVEIKQRKSGEVEKVSVEEVIDRIESILEL